MNLKIRSSIPCAGAMIFFASAFSCVSGFSKSPSLCLLLRSSDFFLSSSLCFFLSLFCKVSVLRIASSAFSILFISSELSFVSCSGITALPASKNLLDDTLIGPVTPISSDVTFLFFNLNLPTFPFTLLNSDTRSSSSSVDSFFSKVLEAASFSLRRVVYVP